MRYGNRPTTQNKRPMTAVGSVLHVADAPDVMSKIAIGLVGGTAAAMGAFVARLLAAEGMAVVVTGGAMVGRGSSATSLGP